jgi:coenzyme F420-reducing hydrogenase delta subunit
MSRSEMINELLEDYGYEKERFAITWVSSAEPDKFVAAVSQMTQRVRQLGPIHESAQAG